MQPLIVTLLDIPVMMEAMNGVCLELQDCALTLLKGQLKLVHIHTSTYMYFLLPLPS